MTNENEPAFPFIYHDREGDERVISGITVREYFAAMSLQGMYSNNGLVDQWNCEGEMAKNAVRAADALIEALNKQP